MKHTCLFEKKTCKFNSKIQLSFLLEKWERHTVIKFKILCDFEILNLRGYNIIIQSSKAVDIGLRVALPRPHPRWGSSRLSDQNATQEFLQESCQLFIPKHV